MAIVKLQKVTFYGLASQRDFVLDGLQQLGCLHLIDLPGNGGKVLEDVERQQVAEAIKYLQSCPIQNSNQHSVYQGHHSCVSVAQEALSNQQQNDQLLDELESLQKAIAALEPWGEFQLPELEQTRGLRLWFYLLPIRQRDALQGLQVPWQIVHQDRQFFYVTVVSQQEPEMPVPRLSLDRRPLSELRTRVVAVNERIEKLHWERVALTRDLALLQRDLNSADDQIARAEALQQMVQDDRLFALQAWAPQSTLNALQDFARKHQLALAVSPPGEDDIPPTLLKNPDVVAGAEGAVTFYMTPSYRAWDPTWIMFGSFTLFFAMIMSDAAYGAILAMGLAFFWQRLGSSQQLRRLRLLLLALVGACIVYGVLAGSYFGATPSLLEPLQLKLDGKPLVNNQNAMMLLALGIGVLHLALANGITFWRNLGSSQALSSLGWSVALLCGFVFGFYNLPDYPGTLWTAQFTGTDPAHFQPLAKQVGMIGLIIGLSMVVLFSSNRPFFSSRPSDWLWRLVDGLMGLTNVSKAFGDTLSYLRLFALGLASAQLAVTFNNLASGVSEMPGLGLVLAFLILVLGHAVNIVLGIMSGVVHGLRLNCIEFFNWSLTEEGYPFRPFCKKVG